MSTFTPEMLVLGKNPHYWKGDELKVDELRMPQMNDNSAALTLLKTGNVDWSHIFIPNIEETYVQGDPHKKYWYGMNDGMRIAFNYKTKNKNNLKAFTTPEFKYALSMAIDRDAINSAASFGHLSDIIPSNTGLPPALFDYRNEDADAITKKYAEYNLDEAKRILTDAGFVDIDGDGFVENPDGSKIEFEILSPAGWSDWNDSVSIAVEGFNKIGVNAHARAIDLSLVIDSWASGNHDALYGGYGNSSDIYRFYFDTLGDQSRILTPTWWSITQTNYENDDISELVQRLSVAETEQEEIDIVRQIEMHFAENMINIPILYNGNWFTYSDKNFTGWSTASNPFVQPALSIDDSKLLQLLALKPVEK